MKNRTIYEQRERINTPITLSRLVMCPLNQNMGTPVTEEKKRDTPITVPSPPTSRNRL